MINRNLLIGAGVLVVGYLLYTKSKKNSVSDVSTDVNTIPDTFVIKSDGYATTYSKYLAPLGNTGTIVYSKISGRTDGSIGMGSPISITAQEFEDAYKQFLKQPKDAFVDKFNQRIVTSDPDMEFLAQVLKLPDNFTIKSNGFNTRYYKDKKFGGVYKQAFSTTGDSGAQPKIITNRAFVEAYNEFLKQPKSNDCEKKWNSKAEIDKGMIGSTRDARKEYFMYNCVNNIKPTVIYN
jgi:hypothetical protein